MSTIQLRHNKCSVLREKHCTQFLVQTTNFKPWIVWMKCLWLTQHAKPAPFHNEWNFLVFQQHFKFNIDKISQNIYICGIWSLTLHTWWWSCFYSPFSSHFSLNEFDDSQFTSTEHVFLVRNRWTENDWQCQEKVWI